MPSLVGSEMCIRDRNITRGSLESKCGHDVLACSPMKAMKWIKTPTIFIIGDKDELVNFDDFGKMYENCFAYPKQMIVEPGSGHPDPRSEEAMEKVFNFFEKNSKIELKKRKSESKESIPKIFDNSNKSNKESQQKENIKK